MQTNQNELSVQLVRYIDADRTIIPLHKPDAFRVNKKGERVKIGKAPLHSNWTKQKYDSEAVLKECVAGGFNVGNRLCESDLVLDVDKKHGGLESLERFKKDFEGRVDLEKFPCVITGNGGLHYYGKKPSNLKTLTGLQAYPGLEWKTVGTQVVAAGSIHPDTGKPYLWDDKHPSITEGTLQWPDCVLKLVARPERKTTGTEAGIYTPRQLEEMLGYLNPENFKAHDGWLKLMMACHHATDGEGVEEFIAWSTSDPDYSDDGELIRIRWNSLATNKLNGITAATLHKALSRAGQSGAIPQPTAAEDFGDDPIDPEEVTLAQEKQRKTIIPTPFVFVPPELIPTRQWIYPRMRIRKFLTLTTAQGGVGKSRIAMTEAVAMASGKPLLGVQPISRLRVWYWNGEDPEEEIDRGFAAICKHYELNPNDVNEYLFRDSGRIMPIKIAQTKSGLTQVAVPVVNDLNDALKEFRIDAMTIDPFVASHAATENDNNAMEIVAKKWAHIADHGNLSIEIIHHNRKPVGGSVGTIDDARGGTALSNAARIRRALNKMTESQAKMAGIDPAGRGHFISADLSNSNLMPPASALNWWQLESVSLENGDFESEPDHLGVPVVYDYLALEDVQTSANDKTRVLDALRKRDNWRAAVASPDWIGLGIANELGLVLDPDANKPERKRVRAMIGDWLKDGTLIEYQGEDVKRNKRTFLKVAPVVAPVTEAV
jgi:hypothetical protein